MNPTLVGKVIYPLHEKLLGRTTFAALRQLEEQQWWSAERLTELRLHKLRDLLIHARDKIPFYADRFRDAGFQPEAVRNFSDMEKLPLLTKTDIKTNLECLTWKDCPGGLQRYNTGGSSGEPLIFYFDKRRQSWDKAARMLTHAWWDVPVGEKELYLWGSPVEATRQDRMKTLRDRLTNELLISAFEISAQSFPALYRQFREFAPACVFGYPSTIELFCRFAAERGEALDDLGVRAVFATAEVLYDHQRQTIGAAFGGVPVTDCYGSREGGFVAHECPVGRYHVMDPNYLVEFLQDGKPAAAGENGEIVLTHLDAWGMPLIRYQTGDIARQGEGNCSCGRGLSTLEAIQGRTTDFIVTPDGRWQHALSLIYIVRDIPGVDEFKIIQHQVDEIEVLLKLLPDLYPADGDDRIVAGFRKRMGESIQVRIERVEEIPRDASGKYRYVVSHVAAREAAPQ